MVSQDFRDTEDLDGFFSGWDSDERWWYDPRSSQSEDQEQRADVDQRPRQASRAEPTGALGGSQTHPPPARDGTLQHPRCVIQLLRRHWWDAEQRRWTGEDVLDLTATKPPDYQPP